MELPITILLWVVAVSSPILAILLIALVAAAANNLTARTANEKRMHR